MPKLKETDFLTKEIGVPQDQISEAGFTAVLLSYNHQYIFFIDQASSLQ